MVSSPMLFVRRWYALDLCSLVLAFEDFIICSFGFWVPPKSQYLMVNFVNRNCTPNSVFYVMTKTKSSLGVLRQSHTEKRSGLNNDIFIIITSPPLQR